MFNKKSIVLSDVKAGSNKKAVLSLQEDTRGVSGTLRLYNFPRELDGICSLGFYIEKKVHKAGLTLKSHMLYEFFIDLKQIPQNFSAAVINFQNAAAAPILYGSSEGSAEDVYGSIISELAGEKVSIKSAESVLDKYGVDYENEEKISIEKEIDKAICENDCVNCIYKKYFFESKNVANKSEQNEEIFVMQSAYAQENREEAKEEIKESKPQSEKTVLFFDKLKPQIDRLFENNPTESNLQALIPSSKWVKVEYEDDGDFYVFGLLYDEDENVRYVCYGVPAVFEQQPPKELSGFPIWLPLGDKEGFGYWLTYQDASTGEPVKAILD